MNSPAGRMEERRGAPDGAGPCPPPAIGEKIRAARALLEDFGPLLLADAKIAALLESVARKAAESRRANVESGVAGACRRCDEEEGGSCCGAGIENRYTPVLLLANLLLGKVLPEERRAANGCYFLGEEGCCLEVRHVLCVNYLCTMIQKTLPTKELIGLQETIGEEMDAVFVLHEAMKKAMERARP